MGRSTQTLSAQCLLLLSLTVLSFFPNLVHGAQHVIWSFGNSLSSQGGTVGRMFACMWFDQVAGQGVRRVDTPRHSPGGATFGNHWAYLLYEESAPTFQNGGSLRTWHPWVILQEQSAMPAIPSQLPISLFNLQGIVNILNTRSIGGIILFQTWGYMVGTSSYGLNHPNMPSHNQALLAGYARMQAETDSDHPLWVAPCGLAWEKVYWGCVERGWDPLEDARCAFKRLYTDPTHPSRQGAYTCALTMISTVTGLHPSTQSCWPYVNGVNPVPREDIPQIRNAVAAAIEETFLSGLLQYPFEQLWPTTAPTTPSPTTLMPTSTAPTTSFPTITPTTAAPTRGTAIVSMTIPPQPPHTTTPTASAAPSISLLPSLAPSTSTSPSFAPTVAPTTTIAGVAETTDNILILGNRVLGDFNVPERFEQIQENALAATSTNVNVTYSTPSDATWKSHVDEILAADPVLYTSDSLDNNGEDFDWIVLQEDPALVSNPGMLPASVDLAGAVHLSITKSHRAKTAFVMTFGARGGYVADRGGPNETTYADFQAHTRALLDGYKQFVNATDTPEDRSFLVPAGLVAEYIYLSDWEIAGRDPANLWFSSFSKLYADDGIHPSALGSYVIALTLSATISGLDLNSITHEPPEDFDQVTLDYVKDAVIQTIAQTRSGSGDVTLEYPWANDDGMPAADAIAVDRAVTKSMSSSYQVQKEEGEIFAQQEQAGLPEKQEDADAFDGLSLLVHSGALSSSWTLTISVALLSVALPVWQLL